MSFFTSRGSVDVSDKALLRMYVMTGGKRYIIHLWAVIHGLARLISKHKKYTNKVRVYWCAAPFQAPVWVYIILKSIVSSTFTSPSCHYSRDGLRY